MSSPTTWTGGWARSASVPRFVHDHQDAAYATACPARANDNLGWQENPSSNPGLAVGGTLQHDPRQTAVNSPVERLPASPEPCAMTASRHLRSTPADDDPPRAWSHACLLCSGRRHQSPCRLIRSIPAGSAPHGRSTDVFRCHVPRHDRSGSLKSTLVPSSADTAALSRARKLAPTVGTLKDLKPRESLL